jgi:tripartite-type tricarboxylate transporter receptor subunit TctC
MLAPAGTPRAVLEKLNAAINDALRSADMQVTLKRLGAEARGGRSQELAAFLASRPPASSRSETDWRHLAHPIPPE